MPLPPLLATLVLLAAGNSPVVADEPEDRPPTLARLVEDIVRASLPQTFEDSRHWDKHEEIFSGFKVRNDGLNVRISKREKSVKHGFWRKYTVTLLNPDETFHLAVRHWQPIGEGRYTFEVMAEVRVRVLARFEHWNLGVKLLNGSTEADASLRLRADCSLQWELARVEDQGPVIVLKPDVVNIDLELGDLDVRKVGELRGSAAAELGNGLQDPIEDLLQTQEKSVRKQAWKEIERHRDDLRLPLASLFDSPWAALLWAR